MAGIMVYAHNNQQNYLPEEAVPQDVTSEGIVLPGDSEFAPVLNKEQWHEDPYAELAQKIKEKNGL